MASLLVTETRLPPFTRAASPDTRFKTTTAWDQACALPLTETGLNGEVTSNTYDNLCRLTRQDKPLGAFSEFTYAGFETHPGTTSHTRYIEARIGATSGTIWSRDYVDGMGRNYATVKEGPGGANANIRIERSFNARGLLASETIPYYSSASPPDSTASYPETPAGTFAVSYGYDRLDRLVKITNGDGTFKSFVHGLGTAASTDSTTVQATDEAGLVSKYTLNAEGKVVGRARVNGGTSLVTRYARDGLGRVTGVTDPLGNVWNYTFDLGGRRTRVEDPDLGTWEYDYDTSSRLTWQKDARNVTTTLSYDDLSRVTQKQVNGASISLATEVTSNSYDDTASNGHGGYANVGQLTDATRQVAAQTVGGVAFEAVNAIQRFDHDLAGRLTRERHENVNGGTRTLAYAFYPTGELQAKQLADGNWTGAYTYDAAGRLSGLGNALFNGSNGATEPSSFIASTAYNARGQTTAITYGSGHQALYDYQDNRGFLMRVRAVNGAATLMDQTYTRKANGQISAVAMANDATRSWNYSYDAYGQLTLADNVGGTAEDRAYSYDAAGNMTRNSGLCAGTTTMVYPAAGHKHAPSTICGQGVT